eukprot:gene2633-5006_t
MKPALEAQLKAALAQHSHGPMHKPAIDIDTPADKTLKMLDRIMAGPTLELQDAILRAGDLRQPVNLSKQLMQNSQTLVDNEVSKSLIQLLSTQQLDMIQEDEQVAPRRHSREAIFNVSSSGVDSLISLVKNVPEPLLTVLEQADGWMFDPFKLHAVSNGRPLSVLSFALFKRSGAVEKFELHEQILVKFLMKIEDGYPNNPYHNNIHSAVMACYLSAIIHDYEHKGVNNDFLVRVSDELAVLYNDRSPMENHHLAAAFSLMSSPEYNFMAKVPRKTKLVGVGLHGQGPSQDEGGCHYMLKVLWKWETGREWGGGIVRELAAEGRVLGISRCLFIDQLVGVGLHGQGPSQDEGGCNYMLKVLWKWETGREWGGGIVRELAVEGRVLGISRCLFIDHLVGVGLHGQGPSQDEGGCNYMLKVLWKWETGREWGGGIVRELAVEGRVLGISRCRFIDHLVGVGLHGQGPSQDEGGCNYMLKVLWKWETGREWGGGIVRELAVEGRVLGISRCRFIDHLVGVGLHGQGPSQDEGGSNYMLKVLWKWETGREWGGGIVRELAVEGRVLGISRCRFIDHLVGVGLHGQGPSQDEGGCNFMLKVLWKWETGREWGGGIVRELAVEGRVLGISRCRFIDHLVGVGLHGQGPSQDEGGCSYMLKVLWKWETGREWGGGIVRELAVEGRVLGISRCRFIDHLVGVGLHGQGPSQDEGGCHYMLKVLWKWETGREWGGGIVRELAVEGRVLGISRCRFIDHLVGVGLHGQGPSQDEGGCNFMLKVLWKWETGREWGGGIVRELAVEGRVLGISRCRFIDHLVGVGLHGQGPSQDEGGCSYMLKVLWKWETGREWGGGIVRELAVEGRVLGISRCRFIDHLVGVGLHGQGPSQDEGGCNFMLKVLWKWETGREWGGGIVRELAVEGRVLGISRCRFIDHLVGVGLHGQGPSQDEGGV